MKVLLDHNLTQHLCPLFPKFDVRSAKEMGWELLANGALVKAAESAQFDVLLTSDKDFAYQRDIRTRRIAVVIVNSNKMAVLLANIPHIEAALSRSHIGSFEKVLLAGVHRRPRR